MFPVFPAHVLLAEKDQLIVDYLAGKLLLHVGVFSELGCDCRGVVEDRSGGGRKSVVKVNKKKTALSLLVAECDGSRVEQSMNFLCGRVVALWNSEEAQSNHPDGEVGVVVGGRWTMVGR